tara:strand:+ start:54 stop:245 length:192 start_codon:yes stop_codon:yes gene_type:complete
MQTYNLDVKPIKRKSKSRGPSFKPKRQMGYTPVAAAGPDAKGYFRKTLKKGVRNSFSSRKEVK